MTPTPSQDDWGDADSLAERLRLDPIRPRPEFRARLRAELMTRPAAAPGLRRPFRALPPLGARLRTGALVAATMLLVGGAAYLTSLGDRRATQGTTDPRDTTTDVVRPSSSPPSAAPVAPDAGAPREEMVNPPATPVKQPPTDRVPGTAPDAGAPRSRPSRAPFGQAARPVPASPLPATGGRQDGAHEPPVAENPAEREHVPTAPPPTGTQWSPTATMTPAAPPASPTPEATGLGRPTTTPVPTARPSADAGRP